jgi:hypothetical protein
MPVKLRIPGSNNRKPNAKFIKNPTFGRKYIKEEEGQRRTDGTHMKHVYFSYK